MSYPHVLTNNSTRVTRELQLRLPGTASGLAPSARGDHGLSRFSREVCPYMLGVSDRAELRRVSRWRRTEYGLPLLLTASALRRGALSRLNTRPARTPVNASRTAAHDSGPVWAANPSPYDSFIRNTSPVSPGAQGGGVDPVSWTPHGWGGRERPRCPRAIGRTRRRSGGR